VFDARGAVVEGPPPRPLDRVEARVEAGTVLVRL
jgi:Rieske Fe-S protein